MDVYSLKVSSSGNTSHSSVNKSSARGISSSRILYGNDKRGFRDKPSTARPRNAHKGKIYDLPAPHKSIRLLSPDTFSLFFFLLVLHVEESSSSAKHHCFISEVPDVRHMERALLGLLEDFHSGKLRAFGGGCTMEQMTNIREQQEKLAKLHFDLAGASDPSLTDESLKQSQNTMSQLIQRLEQLSVSIEGLHSNNEK